MVVIKCKKCNRPIAHSKYKPKKRPTCVSCKYNILLDKGLKTQNNVDELWKRYEKKKNLN